MIYTQLSLNYVLCMKKKHYLCLLNNHTIEVQIKSSQSSIIE